jgi:hypothetical protein
VNLRSKWYSMIMTILSPNHLLTLFGRLFYCTTFTPPHNNWFCRLQVLCVCTSNPYLLRGKRVAQSYSRRTEKRYHLLTLLSQIVTLIWQVQKRADRASPCKNVMQRNTSGIVLTSHPHPHLNTTRNLD